MMKFLTICVVLFLLYLGFNLANEFDSHFNILVFDYKIETTFFIFISLFFIVQLILVMVLRIIFLVFDLPMVISQGWHKRKIRRASENLLKAISDLLMGNRQKSLESISKLVPEFDKNNEELVNLILAESDSNFDSKIIRLTKLVDKKNYSIYAAKVLAEMFLAKGDYKQAEKYASKAFNENDTDLQLILILIRIYAKLEAWSKMIFLTAKLQRADTKFLKANAEEISKYHYLAAKAAVSSNHDEEAIKLLEAALELKPDYLEALNLFTELNINLKNSTAMLKILKAAFATCPSFEIAELYIKCSRSSVDAIYGTLAGIVNPSEHQALFLAIAAYLGLYDKITHIKGYKG